jgi:hypothetical protein
MLAAFNLDGASHASARNDAYSQVDNDRERQS